MPPTGENALEALSTISSDPPRIHFGRNEDHKAFHARLLRARDIAAQLRSAPLMPGATGILKDDLNALLDYVRLEPNSYRSPSDGGARAFQLVDNATNVLLHVAISHGLALVGSDGSYKLVQSRTPTDLDTEAKLKSIEESLKLIQDSIAPETAKQLVHLIDQAKQDSATMKRLLADASKDATTLKVGDYHAFFAKTTKKHQRSATRWLITTALLGLLSAVAAGLSVYQAIHPNTLPERQLEVAIAKAVGVGVLLSATVWAGFNYRSHQHNAVVNEHRGDALGSFDAFWNAATTKEAKDAVLVQASNAIYLPQPSGFSGRDGEANPTSVGLLAGLLSRRE
jgi:hypothetical protein